MNDINDIKIARQYLFAGVVIGMALGGAIMAGVMLVAIYMRGG